jgi:hypothetical protein
VVLPPFADLDGTIRTLQPEVKWEGPVRVVLSRFGFNTEARTDTSGHFLLHAVPPGEWNLEMDAALARLTAEPSRSLYLRPIPLASLIVTESGNAPLDFTLSDHGAKVTGKVEEPGLVSVMSTGFGRSRAAMPTANGLFSVDVAPGEYRITQSGAACARSAQIVSVEGGTTTYVLLKACDRTRN